MNNQYHLLSELTSIIGISLNNIASAGLELCQNESSTVNCARGLIKIPGDILNKLDKGPKYSNSNSTSMFLFHDDFYNHDIIKGMKYILELRAYEHEHFQNMNDVCPPSDYWRQPGNLQADQVRYKIGVYIGDNLLDQEHFNSNILMPGECEGDVYYLKLGLTTEGLYQLIVLEKMSGRSNDFLDVLEFLYYTCEE